MDKQHLPRVLYKYRGPFLCHQRNSLIQSEIYFTDPTSFNDPFDMKIRKKPELISRNDFILQLTYHKGKKYPNESFGKLWQSALQEFDHNMQSDPAFYKRRSIDAYKEERKNIERGVFCLTEKNNNILMWSHYGYSNRGFCLGYNTQRLCDFIREKNIREKNIDLLGIFKVQYATKYPTILPFGRDEESIIQKLATKSILWSYEQEWRLIIQNKTKLAVSIDREIIEEIILGAEICPQLQEEIIEIQKKDFPHAKLLKIFPDDSEFKLNVERHICANS